MPTIRANLGVAAVDGKLYAIGGDIQTETDTNEMYDPATNNWTTKAPMPEPKSSFAIATFQGKIYCLGVTYTFVYDCITNNWTIGKPMPYPRYSASAAELNGKIYVVGGLGRGVTPANYTQIYDPLTDTWSTAEPMPFSLGYCTSVAVNNKMYVFGTYADADVNFSSTQIYDPQTDSWRIGPKMPTILTFGSAGATTGTHAPQKIYAFGSEGTETFDIKTETWSTGATMPTPRGAFGFGLAVIDDIFYIIGGFVAPAYSSYLYIPFGYITNSPPEIAITAPAQGQTYPLFNVDLVFTINASLGNIQKLSYSLDNQIVANITGNVTLNDLSVGSHNLTVFAIDSLGHNSTSQTVTFAIAEPVQTASSSPTPTQQETPQTTTTPTINNPNVWTKNSNWIIIAVTVIVVVTVISVAAIKTKKGNR